MLIAQRWILARLRNVTCFSIAEPQLRAGTATAAAITAELVTPCGSSASSWWATSCRRVGVAAAACREPQVHDQRRRRRDQPAFLVDDPIIVNVS